VQRLKGECTVRGGRERKREREKERKRERREREEDTHRG
jgi:hypothetical protein